MSTPKDIQSRETLSRFIFEKSWIRQSEAKIKAEAFLPNPKESFTTSVFRKDFMSAEEYVNAKTTCELRRAPKSWKGTGLIEANDAIESGLKVEPEESEFKWHADLINWPTEKSAQMLIAKKIAEKAKVENQS